MCSARFCFSSPPFHRPSTYKLVLEISLAFFVTLWYNRKEGGRRGGDDAWLEKGCLGLDDENLGAERANPRLERAHPFLAKDPLFLESSPRYIARAYPFFPKKAPWLHPKTGGYGAERGLTTQRASPWGESALRCKVCAPWGAGYVSQW